MTLKIGPSIFEEIKMYAKNFEKRMYNPKNVTCKSTTDVYFLMKSTERATMNLASEENPQAEI